MTGNIKYRLGQLNLNVPHVSTKLYVWLNVKKQSFNHKLMQLMSIYKWNWWLQEMPTCHSGHVVSSVVWKFRIQFFLELASFWSLLSLVIFLGLATTGLAFFEFCFGTPLRPEFLAFWFLTAAACSFCSWSRCSHL